MEFMDLIKAFLSELIVLGVGVVGFICLAASCGGNEWVTSSGGGNSGLWKICTQRSGCFANERKTFVYSKFK